MLRLAAGARSTAASAVTVTAVTFVAASAVTLLAAAAAQDLSFDVDQLLRHHQCVVLWTHTTGNAGGDSPAVGWSDDARGGSDGSDATSADAPRGLDAAHFAALQRAFAPDAEHVTFREHAVVDGFAASDLTSAGADSDDLEPEQRAASVPGLHVFVAREKDFSCLVPPPPAFFSTPEPESLLAGDEAWTAFADAAAPQVAAATWFVNRHCSAFRSEDGLLTELGARIRDLEESTWGVSVSTDHKARRASEASAGPKADRFPSGGPAAAAVGAYAGSADAAQQRRREDGVDTAVARREASVECPRVSASALTPQQFMDNYVTASQPVVVTDATTHWPAVSANAWSNAELRRLIGSQRVHVKVSDDGRFEGPEDIRRWVSDIGHEPDVPDFVRDRLQSPELVLVRPAAVDMSFNDFLDFMYAGSAHHAQRGGGGGGEGNATGVEGSVCADGADASASSCAPALSAGADVDVDGSESVAAATAAGAAGAAGTAPGRRAPASLYIEYLSMDGYVKELNEHVTDFKFAARLTNGKRHFWFGNGNTTGKLHFDGYDNMLSPVAGSKHLTLIGPHRNEDVYEGHMMETMLAWDADTGAVTRDQFLESTSMVNSPVDLEHDAERRAAAFPRFADAERRAVHCDVYPGESLFLPAYWWHEVRSQPDAHGRNVAVNYWYDPWWEKRFPCAECRPYVNPVYYDELRERWGLAA